MDEARDVASVLAGGGENGARLRAIDWSSTPLGPVSAWPQSLKTCVRIILTSRQPMFVWWGDSLINLYNDAYQSIVGGKHPGALGQPASLVWREIWNEVGPRAATAMRDNEGTYDEALLLIMERNGYPEETYYTFSYSPVPGDSGGPGGLICANTDDTQRIIGERQLALLREVAAQTAEARSIEEACASVSRALATDSRDLPFALLYLATGDGRSFSLCGATGIAEGSETAPQSISIDDPNARWPLAEAMRRTVPQPIAFESKPTLVDPAWPQPLREAVLIPIGSSAQAWSAGVLVVGLNPYRLFDGGYRAFLELVAGQIAASIGSAQAYENERKRAEALAEIDRAKTAFFSNVSHEFRTPLTLMLGPAEDLLAGVHGPLAEAQRNELALLSRNGLRLQKLVNTLLDFSRIEAGRVDASYRLTDVAAFTAELASVFRSAVEKAGLRFVVDCRKVDGQVYLDATMWEKIVFNLLSNALKFTFEGEIAVTVRGVDSGVELEVRDTGVGVPKAEVPKLFERFHRVQNTRARSHEGSGIGLALVSQLVHLHGGEVRAESEENVGTRFVVTLPFGSAHLPSGALGSDSTRTPTRARAEAYVDEATRWMGDAAAVANSIATHAPAPADPRGLPQIVLADDNTDMREYVERLLSDRYLVRAFGNGRAALESIQAHRPDLVLTDVMMPELDGFGLLHALRADRATRNIPIVMLSARAGDEARVEGIEAGADDYLVKPFSSIELLARIAARIEIARVRGEAEIERANLHVLFMNSPAVIAVMRGPTHIFELANPPYLALVGGREVIGRSVREAFPEVADQGYPELLDAVFATNRPHVGHESPITLIQPSGQTVERFLNFVYAPYADAEGAVKGVAIYGFDVTDLVVSRRHAEAATRARDDFLSVASHELRTPITSLMLQGQLTERLLARIPEATLALGKVRAMRGQVKRLETLVNGLLDVSRIAAGRLALDPEEVDLGALARDVLERHAEQANNVGSTLAIEAATGLTGRWDPFRLDQIMTNLLTNAIKYGRGQEISVSVSLHAGNARMVVRDRGIGIAPDDLTRLYRRFERFVPSESYAGLGLGLWIVRNIVDTMGGHIEVHSVLGEGTTFTVEIPQSPPSSPTAS